MDERTLSQDLEDSPQNGRKYLEYTKNSYNSTTKTQTVQLKMDKVLQYTFAQRRYTNTNTPVKTEGTKYQKP